MVDFLVPPYKIYPVTSALLLTVISSKHIVNEFYHQFPAKVIDHNP